MELLKNPSFKKENLERYQQRKLKDLEYNELKYNYRATQQMFHTFFAPGTPTAAILTKEHILEISTANLQNYYQNNVNAQNTNIFIAGNIDEDLEQLIYTHFRSLPTGDASTVVSQFISTFKPEIIIDEQINPLQSSIMLCKKGISFRHEDRRDFSILSTLLGGYFGSRLMQNLREKNGYTYSVQSGSLYLNDGSIFYVESDVTIDKTKEAIEQCLFELDRLKTEKVSETELKLVQRYMLGSLLRDIDGVVSYMKKYAFWNHFGLDELEIEHTINAINHVNQDTIIKNAKKYLQNEDFYTIIVGKL
jgi:predicted Zn-dependent peptidase